MNDSRFSEEAFQLWKNILGLINTVDEAQNGDELTIINSGFCPDDDDFYMGCVSTNKVKNIGIFYDGSLSISVIGKRDFDHFDYSQFYNPKQIPELHKIVNIFLDRCGMKTINEMNA